MSTEERSSQEGIIGVFSRAASTYDSIGPRFFSQLGQRLVEVSHVTPGADVLDVAAGRGAVLFAAADQVGPEGLVVGIDLAEIWFERPRRKFRTLDGRMSRCIK